MVRTRSQARKFSEESRKRRLAKFSGAKCTKAHKSPGGERKLVHRGRHWYIAKGTELEVSVLLPTHVAGDISALRCVASPVPGKMDCTFRGVVSEVPTCDECLYKVEVEGACEGLVPTEFYSVDAGLCPGIELASGVHCERHASAKVPGWVQPIHELNVDGTAEWPKGTVIEEVTVV